MAEFLTWVGPSDESDAMRPRIGDIISVNVDGFTWGTAEALDKFLVVSIPTMTREEAQAFQGPWMGELTATLDDDGNPIVVDGETMLEHPTLGYSRYKIDISGVDLDSVRVSDWTVPVLTVDKIIDRATA